MNRAAIGSIALIAGLACLVPAEARAWTCGDSSCPVWCGQPVGYQIGALPAGLDEDTVLAEIHRAFDDWEAVECSRLSFTYEGRIPEGGATAPITVEWLTDWPYSSTAISIAGTTWSMDDGCIMSSPIEHNAVHFDWASEATGASEVDIYTGTLFAIGLSVGLGHSEDRSALLYPSYDGPKELGDDDIEGVCNLYPAGGTPDAGGPAVDAGATPDGGAPDAGAATTDSDDGGCSCRTSSPARAAPTWALLALVIGWVARRRARRP